MLKVRLFYYTMRIFHLPYARIRVWLRLKKLSTKDYLLSNVLEKL